jgi:hypothetical protein
VTYFGLQQRHNLNIKILSSIDLFAERVIFQILLLEKTKKKVLKYFPVALSKCGMGLVFLVMLLDSLRWDCKVKYSNNFRSMHYSSELMEYTIQHHNLNMET